MRNTAVVTGGKPIAVLLQFFSGVTAINPLDTYRLTTVDYYPGYTEPRTERQVRVCNVKYVLYHVNVNLWIKPFRSSARGASFHTKHASNANVVRKVLQRFRTTSVSNPFRTREKVQKTGIEFGYCFFTGPISDSYSSNSGAIFYIEGYVANGSSHMSQLETSSSGYINRTLVLTAGAHAFLMDHT
jgi:hypothetical protein